MAAENAEDEELDPDRQWFFDRLRDMHDLWHVLTGYGRDEAGEAANLAFTFAQTRHQGIGVIVVAAALIGSRSNRFEWQRYLYRAWRRGRRAAWLPAVAYERLLDRPLEEVRRSLAIEPPELAHPQGIIVANRDDAQNAALQDGAAANALDSARAS
jgi:ubiquinone biosynthesis protein COQ4